MSDGSKEDVLVKRKDWQGKDVDELELKPEPESKLLMNKNLKLLPEEGC